MTGVGYTDDDLAILGPLMLILPGIVIRSCGRTRTCGQAVKAHA
jgi:hypothetical protein